ncbi:MAG TPA: sugar phosphate isomerase/epimerase family protein [Chloroflexia bacterium]|nr:sugar phosphate isomerase/epimerase family protein [Chloroflexia bacterium]
MLKFSFMSCVAPGWNFDRLVEVAAELNYQGIEFRVGARQNHGVELGLSSELIKNYKDKLAHANLEAACLATSILYSPQATAQHRFEINEQITVHIQLAAELGAPLIRVSAKSFNNETELESLVEDLRVAGEKAAAYGVTVALETTAGLNSARKVRAVLEKVNLASVGALWDVYHTSRSGEDLSESYDLLKPFLRHLHLNQLMPQKRIITLSQPSPPVDFPAFFSLLQAANYSGFVSGEWLGVPESQAFELLKNYRLLLQNWLTLT